MDQMSDKIVLAVDEAISTLIYLFQRNRLVSSPKTTWLCCFYRILYNTLETLCLLPVLDSDGMPQNLIHCEYPTPFRCDMRNGGFVAKSDEDRTEKGESSGEGITISSCSTRSLSPNTHTMISSVSPTIVFKKWRNRCL